MYLRITFFVLAFAAVCASCSSDTKATEKAPSKEIIQEVQNLDSLNQNIEQSTSEIEESIQSVEDAVNEISNF